MRGSLILSLLASGCAYHLGSPRVQYGDPVSLPIVQPSTDSRRWYIPIESDSLGPQLLFVDTGYTHTNCDDDLVRGLSLATRGKRRIRGEFGKVDALKTRLPPLELGGHTVEGLVCLSRDLDSTSSIDDPREVPIAGVLGMDVLRRFRVVFDPENGLMHLLDPSTAAPIEGEGVSRLKRSLPMIEPRVKLELDVAGRDLWPLIDTGAADTYVDGARYDLEPAFQVQGRSSGTGGSAVLLVSHYELEAVEVGGVATGPVTLMDRDRGCFEPGLLGLSLLSRFHQEYDFEQGRARLSPAPARPLPQWSDWSATGTLAGRLRDAAPEDALTLGVGP